MTVDNRKKNERSRTGNPYSSHVKAGKHAGTVYNFKRKSRIRKSLTRLPILLEFIHKYIFLNFVSFYNGLNSNESVREIIDVNEKQVIPMPTIMNANQSCFNDVASYDKQLIVMFEVSKLMPQSEQQGIKQLIDDNT